jgi:hypothetical protein
MGSKYHTAEYRGQRLSRIEIWDSLASKNATPKLYYGVFLTDRYSHDRSAGYRFTSLGRLKENFAWFDWEIVTIG